MRTTCTYTQNNKQTQLASSMFLKSDAMVGYVQHNNTSGMMLIDIFSVNTSVTHKQQFGTTGFILLFNLYVL